LNEETAYLYRPEDCVFIRGSIEAVSKLKAAGFLVVVVTNQSGIARGYYTEADVIRLHDYMISRLKDCDASVDGWYYCPHHPDYSSSPIECSCRKPLPGMLLRAAEEMGIDLASSWMVGDKTADVEAGIAAGCKPILVLTGHGESERAKISSSVPVCNNLFEAARYIIAAKAEV
jgi:D-glycero-D-manno-heptose 1,7-bisphosphate phosphatase